jgi:hypothetical protein
MAHAGVPDLVEKGQTAIIGVDTASVDGDGTGVGGPHKESSWDEPLVREILQKLHAHPPEI